MHKTLVPKHTHIDKMILRGFIWFDVLCIIVNAYINTGISLVAGNVWKAGCRTQPSWRSYFAVVSWAGSDAETNSSFLHSQCFL